MSDSAASGVVAAAPSPAARLLSGAILPTLLKLGVPNVLAMTVAVTVSLAETFYIGVLGTESLAAMAIVFPFIMLTQMMSNGAMGGGISSAISRALGAGDERRANALAWHAVALGLAIGLVYSLLLGLFAIPLLSALGARGSVLELARTYALPLFYTAFTIWLMNTLASVIRGTGNMSVPSIVIFATALQQILVGGILGLGLGPIPRFGLPGVAAGQIVSSVVGIAAFAAYLAKDGARVRPTLAGGHVQAALFGSILRVGALACLSPVQNVIVMMVLTGLVARLGLTALAGYGIGQRLEFMLVPISFGMGVASVPMVGMAIGAGNVARARQVAWTAASVSATVLAVVGVTLAFLPDLWTARFTQNLEVLEIANRYFRIAGPGFAFFGFGLTLYFASQGSGKVLGPVLTATLRLVLIIVIGTVLNAIDAGVDAYFWLIMAGMIAYGLSTALVVRTTRW